MTRRQHIEERLNAFLEAHRAPHEGVSCHVVAVMRRVHDSLFDPNLNVNTVKNFCGIGDNNVSCRFKHEVGVSIKSYIERLRVDAARMLLDDGRFSVAEIAQSVGYAHLQTFYAAFGRHFDGPPGEFRRDEWTRAEDSDRVA
jgi:AraC-like DNA-binding protein